MKSVKRTLGRVVVPIFIAHGGRDLLALPKSAAFLHDHVGTVAKTGTMYPHSAHGLLLDAEREDVFADIRRFFAAFA